MNLNIEIDPVEMGSHFAVDFMAFREAINVVADWKRSVGTGSYDEYIASDASKEMAVNFGIWLKKTDRRDSKRTISFLKGVIEAYEMDGRKIIYTSSLLDKNQIFNLILTDEETNYGDLAGYAEMHFGPQIFNEGFDKYTDKEVQDWYYLEYLSDRETDIAEGHYRGQ